MVSKPIDMKYIYKRQRYLERKKALKESYIEMPDLSGIESPSLYKIKVENYTKDCASYKYALNLLETLYTDNRFDLLESVTQKIINEIIPMVESAELPNCIDHIKRLNIGEVNKDRLIETTKMYKSVDRIRKNHKNLSKRFELEQAFGKGRPDRAKCFAICEMIDTYDSLSTFIKFNIALEELTYLGYYDGSLIDESVMVEHVLDYFLMRENNTEEDINLYKRAIDESKVICEGADSRVQFFMNNKNTTSNHWLNKLNEWKLNPNKDLNTLVEIARENYSDLTALSKIITTVNEFVDINNLEFDKMSIFESVYDGIDGAQARNIMTLIKENNISNSDELFDGLRSVWEADLNDEVYADGSEKPMTFTSDEIDKFKVHNLIVDAKDAGEFIDHLEKTSMKETPLKISNIISADDTNINESNILDFVDSNGYISLKLRSYFYEGKLEDIYSLMENTVKCINNMLYGRNSKAYYIHRENSFDLYLRSTYCIELTEAEELSKGFATSEKDILCRFLEYANVADILAESPINLIMDKLNDRSYAATISAEEAALVYEIMSPYISPNNNFMEAFIDICKEEANPKYDRIKAACMYANKDSFDPTEDHMARLEFCAYDVMGIDETLNEAGAIKKAVNKAKAVVGNISGKSGEASNVDVVAKKDADKKAEEANNANGVQVNNQNATNQQRNDANASTNNAEPTKDNAKTEPATDDEKVNESPAKDAKASSETKKPLSLNDLKLAWQGVKSKLKGASAKEKELSRDLDMEFNHLCNNIQSTFGTNHREEIITGQVNKSLSKILKIGIALAGAGGLTKVAMGANPLIAPAIGAVVLFAKSKYTSNKEKKLIIDEIDIELQVLDREIERAQSSGSTKKYRELLTIQKNLQRKRQEIYYGLAKKGQRIPMQSTVGMRGRE